MPDMLSIDRRKDAVDGQHEPIHQNPLGGVGPRSTPTIEGDLVYAQGATGTLWCVNWTTGETIWSVDLLKEAGWDQTASEEAISWGRAGSPLLVDGLCVVPFGGPSENEQDGAQLDCAAMRSRARSVGPPDQDQISYASPGLLTLAGSRQIVSRQRTIDHGSPSRRWRRFVGV